MNSDSLFFCLRDGELVATNELGNQDARLAAADSWLVDEGRVRSLDKHFDRFRSAIARVAPDHEHYLDKFFDCVVGALPRTGRWFPRIEFHSDPSSEHHLHLRLREAPEALTSAALWTLDEPDPRSDSTIKGPDLSLGQQLRRRANINGADEAILLNQDGVLLEGALSSLVWWRDGLLCAPGPELEWLPSVTRELIWELADQMGISTRFESVKPPSLNGLEIWLLSSLHGIRVVTSWSDLPDGPGVAEHLDAFNRRLRMLAKALD